jgi:AcrR family transcriptional regulator
VPRKLDDKRRAELLDGVMTIIAARGFLDVQVADMARELHCSALTLYKIAPSKGSLVLLAIGRWAETTFEILEARVERATTATDRARSYFQGAAECLRPISLPFVRDAERFESTRVAWRINVADRFVNRLVELIQDAQEAGEVRPLNLWFLAELLNHIGSITRDERVLRVSGLTREQAFLEVEGIIWDGIRAG